MATHLLNTPQNPPKPNNIIKWYPQQANETSFWAFLLSIFIYISIFYVFKLPSASTLFSTTKFWFFISNTLILIIAIDFSSSRKNDHLYDEFMASCRENKPSSLELQYSDEIVKRTFHCSSFRHNMVKDKSSDVRSLIPSTNDIVSTRTPMIVTKNNLDIIVRDNSKKPSDNFREKPLLLEYASNDNYEAREEAKMEATMVKNDHDQVQKTSLLQPKIEKNDSHVEENEFSTMSNEELNKRVEEFIRRCNRQIRLQAAARNSNSL